MLCCATNGPMTQHDESVARRVRISLGAPLWYKTARAKTCNAKPKSRLHPTAAVPTARSGSCVVEVATDDRDRGESRDSSPPPPTPPYIRVRIRRFDRLSTVGVSRRAGESDSGVRRNGFGPFERRIRASPFLIAAKASDLDIRPHGRFEVSTSKRPSIVQAFSETRSAYYAFC